jgi:hypothetical protein
MNEQLPNRVEMELSQLQLRETRLRKLFPSAALKDRALTAEKLKYYRYILTKYNDTKSRDEVFLLRMIKSETKKLMAELYPNVVIQLFHRLLNSLIVKKINIRNYIKEQQSNNQSLQDTLVKAGFKDIFSKVERAMIDGQTDFTVPVSHYINEKERLDKELFFIKEASGYYKFEGYKATLYNELRPNETRDHFFKIDLNSFSPKEAYNLLAGRALQKDNVWVQFDLNDKDSSGSYRIKEFHSDYGYDLEKVLSDLRFKELGSDPQTHKLLQGLKEGSREAVAVIKNEREYKCYIEANPHFKTINIYDENSKKITLMNALVSNVLKTEKQHRVKELQLVTDSKKKGVRIS